MGDKLSKYGKPLIIIEYGWWEYSGFLCYFVYLTEWDLMQKSCWLIIFRLKFSTLEARLWGYDQLSNQMTVVDTDGGWSLDWRGQHRHRGVKRFGWESILDSCSPKERSIGNWDQRHSRDWGKAGKSNPESDYRETTPACGVASRPFCPQPFLWISRLLSVA